MWVWHSPPTQAPEGVLTLPGISGTRTRPEHLGLSPPRTGKISDLDGEAWGAGQGQGSQGFSRGPWSEPGPSLCCLLMGCSLEACASQGQKVKGRDGVGAKAGAPWGPAGFLRPPEKILAEKFQKLLYFIYCKWHIAPPHPQHFSVSEIGMHFIINCILEPCWVLMVFFLSWCYMNNGAS